ncbi:hypothetical protein PVK06_018305 [Gossypium arboreum]|uniref:Uncharacterized protein n=1 Tax=Gossypium arboreum TaxID=29729 RepID=A0ABR0Q5U9_GOSAR|nr:hypothetical protein PVK06_018305 [Gossypium arboreum]
MDGNGFYLVQFYHVVNLKKMISIHKFAQGENLKDVNFYYADSRIQVHNDFSTTLEGQMRYYTISIYAFAINAQLSEFLCFPYIY